MSQILEVLVSLLDEVVLVVLGAVVTIGANTFNERRQWARKKSDQLAVAKREALERALGCIDPIRDALESLTLLVSCYLTDFSMTDEEFLPQYSSLLPTGERLDISLAQRVLLPAGVHEELLQVYVSLAVRLSPQVVKWGQEARRQNRPMLGLHEMGQQIDSLSKQVEDVKDRLVNSYNDTYGV